MKIYSSIKSVHHTSIFFGSRWAKFTTFLQSDCHHGYLKWAFKQLMVDSITNTVQKSFTNYQTNKNVISVCYFMLQTPRLLLLFLFCKNGDPNLMPLNCIEIEQTVCRTMTEFRIYNSVINPLVYILFVYQIMN